jgi:hypothetical protein
MKAVLFKSKERFAAFREMLANYGIDCTVLDFESQEWVDHDYSGTDMVIYYPSFLYSSNHPLALYHVYDNLIHLSTEHPHLKMYPDPKVIRFYNDKYRQYLFLRNRDYPIPDTLPLFSKDSLRLAEEQLGFPMVVKNRYGAGGGSVFKVRNRKELLSLFRLSTLDLFNAGGARHLLSMLTKRIFYYHLIKARRMTYPFLSPPLLAQRYLTLDRDIKTVVGGGKVVEAHWRLQANEEQWKVNIDGGGIGEWSRVPQEVLDVSERLARDLRATWLNIDIIPSGGKYYITEFSPVWHHYAYREKPSFVYKDDYNIDVPLEESLNLEKMIVESLMA